MRNLVLPSALEFVGVPKCSIDQSDINPKRGKPAANGGGLMEVECVVPTVMVKPWGKNLSEVLYDVSMMIILYVTIMAKLFLKK